MIGQKILLSTTVRSTHCRRPLELHWYLPESSTLTWQSKLKNSRYKTKKDCSSKQKKNSKLKLKLHWYLPESSTLTWQSNSKYKIKKKIKSKIVIQNWKKIKIEIALVSVRVLHSSNLTWQSTISTSTSIDLGEDLTIAVFQIWHIKEQFLFSKEFSMAFSLLVHSWAGNVLILSTTKNIDAHPEYSEGIANDLMLWRQLSADSLPNKIWTLRQPGQWQNQYWGHHRHGDWATPSLQP